MHGTKNMVHRAQYIFLVRCPLPSLGSTLRLPSMALVSAVWRVDGKQIGARICLLFGLGPSANIPGPPLHTQLSADSRFGIAAYHSRESQFRYSGLCQLWEERGQTADSPSQLGPPETIWWLHRAATTTPGSPVTCSSELRQAAWPSSPASPRWGPAAESSRQTAVPSTASPLRWGRQQGQNVGACDTFPLHPIHPPSPCGRSLAVTSLPGRNYSRNLLLPSCPPASWTVPETGLLSCRNRTLSALAARLKRF